MDLRDNVSEDPGFNPLPIAHAESASSEIACEQRAKGTL
jgi:hypothetical protein